MITVLRNRILEEQFKRADGKTREYIVSGILLGLARYGKLSMSLKLEGKTTRVLIKPDASWIAKGSQLRSAIEESGEKRHAESMFQGLDVTSPECLGGIASVVLEFAKLDAVQLNDDTFMFPVDLDWVSDTGVRVGITREILKNCCAPGYAIQHSTSDEGSIMLRVQKIRNTEPSGEVMDPIVREYLGRSDTGSSESAGSADSAGDSAGSAGDSPDYWPIPVPRREDIDLNKILSERYGRGRAAAPTRAGVGAGASGAGAAGAGAAGAGAAGAGAAGAPARSGSTPGGRLSDMTSPRSYYEYDNNYDVGKQHRGPTTRH